MRPSQKNRNARNKSGRKPIGNIVNRVYESAGPEGKVRGTPQQIIDKYLLLARDAQTSGDRVMAENFLQHAEHYIRMLSAAQAQMDERRQHAQASGARFDDDQRDDAEDGDEGAYAGPADRYSRSEDRSEAHRRNGDGSGSSDVTPASDTALETIDPRGDDDDGPVATPEERAARPSPAKARGSEGAPVDKVEAEPEQASGAESTAAEVAPEAAEAPRPARRPRRRTPKADDKKSDADSSQDVAAG
ncbi:MAG: DUF4167 domain-containing protein [Rhodobacteraceae bacterium]|nr:MAG: DUF4167 domain-containing protein [Paracoccaceae bacterium]